MHAQLRNQVRRDKLVLEDPSNPVGRRLITDTEKARSFLLEYCRNYLGPNVDLQVVVRPLLAMTPGPSGGPEPRGLIERIGSRLPV